MMLDTQEVFSIPFKVLKFFGIWQEKSSSWCYRLYGSIFIIFGVNLYALLMFLYLFHVENFQELSDCLAVFSSLFAECFKVFYLIFKVEHILTLVKNLDQLIKLSECKLNENHEKICKRVRRLKQIYKFLVCKSVATLTLTCLIPIIHWREHKLAFQMYLPMVDYANNDGLFIATAVYQMLVIVLAQINMTLDILPMLFMCFVIGLIEELSDQLRNIGEPKNNLQRTKQPGISQSKHVNNSEAQELLKCIKIHQGIKKFIADTQKHFAVNIMIQGAMSSIILCTSAFTLSLVSFNLDFKKSFS